MKDQEEITINNIVYIYCSSYDRLTAKKEQPASQKEVACPKCFDTNFTISYGDWECIAHCKCGHSMTVYDG